MKELEINGLNIQTYIGIHDWEQKIKQRLVISLKLLLPDIKAEEDINNTVDYTILSSLITTYVEENSFKLIETVAEKIAEIIKIKFNTENVRVSVSKPGAVVNAQNVTVHYST